MQITPVILSGGSGTRLWPLSRKQHPKQYLSLADEQTMLQATIQRLQGLENLAAPIVICNQEHRFLVAEQLQQINVEKPTIILEPEGKNTAPAIAAAAHYITTKIRGHDLNSIGIKDRVPLSSSSQLLLVLPADHIIQDTQAFHQAIKIARKQAEQDKLVTFGITPVEPNTGYGYIEKSSEMVDQICKIKRFVEKPDLETAKQYLKDGNYLWNSGMFVFSAQNYLKELNKYNPKISESCKQAIEQAKQDYDFLRLDPTAFSESPADSIDYAVMEKTENAVVVALDAGWNDIGNWSALYQIGEKDKNGNVIKGNAMITETTNSYINANHHMIATIGVDDLVIVDSADATLVVSKDKAQQVKQIVEQLQQQNRAEEQLHRKVYRPWGWYDTIDNGYRFKVKRICVNPEATLSLQKHYHRAEHWIVVKGTAQITNGEQKELLNENQSTYIPIGATHRLENPGKLPLEMIEVQSGSYLGEDDIERIEDNYGRI